MKSKSKSSRKAAESQRYFIGGNVISKNKKNVWINIFFKTLGDFASLSTRFRPTAKRCDIFSVFVISLLLIILTTSCSQKFPKGNLFDLMILRKLLTKPTVQTTTTATTTPTVNTNKYIFVTATRDGNLAGISGADTFCQSQKTASFSTLAGEAIEYKALLVDSSGTRIACTNPDCSPVVSTDLAKWVLKANTDYYRLDGTTDTKLFTTNSSGIVNFTGGSSLLTAIDSTGSWWTGLATDWTDSGFSCNNWTSNSATFGKKGNGGNTNANAIAAAGTTSCAVLNKIVCVRQ